MKPFRAFAQVVLATITLIAACQLAGLSVFPAVSLITSLVLALTLSAGAYALFYVVAIPVCVPFKLSPGVLLQTGLGTIAGALAIWIGALTFHQQFISIGFWGAIPYAFANTMMIWALGYVTNTLRKDLHWLPKRMQS